MTVGIQSRYNSSFIFIKLEGFQIISFKDSNETDSKNVWVDFGGVVASLL